ncbi:MAG: hypothetical protein QOI51_2037 [Nocardioidaceae bacterium]|jgi:hypothetical protein|nr:hypothetical protein [Nocardioidaceae bacterium]MDX6310094.1 hypothetical protein [Nocardioidaceae bacterium]
MIIRILTEGQYSVPESELEELNVLDEKLEAAIESGDEEAFAAALRELLDRVRSVGSELPADELVESELLLPFSDATLSEVRGLLSGDGLIPGRSQGTAPADA